MQEQHPLQLAIEELKSMPTVKIKGKAYTQVSTRINAFRKYFPLATIETLMIHNDDHRVIVQSKIKIDDNVIATGYAEEVRGDGNFINTTSAVENCETSSIGRALSAFGLAGGEYASSFEVANAVVQQTHNQSTSSSQHNNYVQEAHQPNQSQNQSYQQSFSPHEFSSLYSLGLQVLEKGSNLVIVGDRDIIFNSKDSIKAFSFRWSSQEKHWYRSINEQQVA
ncbi:MAG: hypothetical protein COA30_00845 [Sulfurimonas sp.]|nr:MAG: hypothetical protein COA30_00845 [Sulfurimonas sp.]